ncbi:MAG TPA: alkaline phosphatase family protein [Stellaceae bacterium]|nr:alkaline phosphatase family protein [Stellaceae bacterium]
MAGETRAVIVICDSLRADLISPEDAPFLSELARRAAHFTAHRSVFPSTTRASSASIATGCQPGRHGLLGNTMALDEGGGLVCRNAGAPDFRDRMRRATGRTLRVPTLAERLRWHGETAITCSNVSPGAAYFQDPDGHGWVYHAAGSYGPDGAIDDKASRGLSKGIAGDAAMTDRFCEEIVEQRAPGLALMWLSEPDYTGHHGPLGSPGHRRAIAAADANVRRVFETVRRLDPKGDDILFITGSDHGMETVTDAIDLDGLLIDARLKEGRGSPDVVVAPQGTAATIFFAEAARGRAGEVARFLAQHEWAGRVVADAELAALSLPTDGALRVALSLAADDRVNPFGVRGHAGIVADPNDPESKIGFGQHGGLGRNEQNPFLMIDGGGFEPGARRLPSSLIDIAPTVLRHLHMDHDDTDGRALPQRHG